MRVIQFACIQCGRVFTVKPSDAGSFGHCKTCGTKNVVPAIVDLAKINIRPSIVEAVPEVIARTHCLMPLTDIGGQMTVAVADAVKASAVSLERLIARKVKLAIAPREMIEAAINRYYSIHNESYPRTSPTTDVSKTESNVTTATQVCGPHQAAPPEACKEPSSTRGFLADLEIAANQPAASIIDDPFAKSCNSAEAQVPKVPATIQAATLPEGWRLGGLNEPYCERCYETAGKLLFAAQTKSIRGTCAFCSTPVFLENLFLGPKPQASGAVRGMAFPWRRQWAFVCPKCTKQSKSFIAGIRECCECGKSIPTGR